ncbi:RNA-binding protein [Enhygromyxa salina]
MSTKLFVGGLPWAMDNQRLKEVFAEFGDVEDARVVLDRETGRSRGFGFVTFATPEAAESAMALNGQDVDGRPIRIDRAQEKQRPGRGGGGRSSGPDRGSSQAGAGRGDRDRGAAPGRSRGAPPGGEGGRREFGDDWGGGGDRDRSRGGKGKGRGRRRGGRGGRGGGEGGHGDGGFNEWD